MRSFVKRVCIAVLFGSGAQTWQSDIPHQLIGMVVTIIGFVTLDVLFEEKKSN